MKVELVVGDSILAGGHEFGVVEVAFREVVDKENCTLTATLVVKFEPIIDDYKMNEHE